MTDVGEGNIVMPNELNSFSLSTNKKMKQLIIVISIIGLSNCTNSKNDFKLTSEKNLVYINAFLDHLPVFAPVTLTANDSLLFGFIKGAIESDTSWNLMM